MKRRLGDLGITAVVSAIISAALLVWLTYDPAPSIEFSDNAILLNIPLTKPTTCKEIFTELGIDNIPYKGKIYYPVCTTVEPDLIVVTYKEKIVI